jgi:hypothetical protein
MWKFADNTLTFVRTFRSGAYRMRFAIARNPAGLTCAATGAFARENGDGTIRMESASGREVTLVGANPVSSSCKIVRKKV